MRVLRHGSRGAFSKTHCGIGMFCLHLFGEKVARNTGAIPGFIQLKHGGKYDANYEDDHEMDYGRGPGSSASYRRAT